jgi:hypothetical protein
MLLKHSASIGNRRLKMSKPSGFAEYEAVPARPLGGLAIHRMACKKRFFPMLLDLTLKVYCSTKSYHAESS